MELEKEIKQSKFKSEQHKMLLNILFTGSWLNNNSIKRFKPFGISPQQYNILRILRGQYPKPASVNLLIERMLDKNSNASRLVEKLRQKKFLKRVVCNEDRRSVNILITVSGLNLLNEIENEEKQEMKKMFSHITEKEAYELNRILDKFRK
ncbi:MAG TPA: MarR family transcriptional regulator [Bacteroidia bacterium]|nr:MarR family transcriptional regulator [Bacteroidia bacterium]